MTTMGITISLAGIPRIKAVSYTHLPAALHGNIERPLCDPANLILIICKGITGSQDAVDLFCPALSEIQSSGQFPHNHQVKSALGNLFLKRACALQFIIQDGWP